MYSGTVFIETRCINSEERHVYGATFGHIKCIIFTNKCDLNQFIHKLFIKSYSVIVWQNK